jgi:tetratricopeptide (TPR) repeat protein
MDDLGIAYYQKKEYRQAIDIFQRKIGMDPQLPNSYLNLAYCYLQMKSFDSVLVTLERMLAIDSCNQQALEIGSYVALFEMSKYNVGRQWLDKRLACNPADCDAIMYSGYTYLVTNDTAQIRRNSIPDLKKAYECRLANGEKKCGDQAVQNAFWLAQAYMAQRDLEQVVRWCDKVLDCEPGHEGAKKLKAQAQSEY